MADYTRSVLEESTISPSGTNRSQAALRIRADTLSTADIPVKIAATLRAAIEELLTVDTSVQRAKLVADDAADGDYFGVNVAIDGDTCIIGAYLDDHAGGTDAGSAYVFTRSGTTWSQQAKLVADDAAGSDQFGWSVALDGDTCIVGADRDTHAGGTNAGSAYVFTRSGSTWSQQAKLVADDAADNDFFGISVAIDGDTCIVGAHGDNHAGGGDAGSAYVFTRSGITWSQQAKLVADDAADNDQFGHSVALDGDTCAVGAHGDDHAGGTNAGSAYIFTRSGITWSQQAKLVADDAADGDFFGYNLALDGNTCVAGARYDDHAGGSDAGSAYIFTRSGITWSQQAKLVASDAEGNDGFGWSVDVKGDVCTIGAYLEDEGGGNAGSAYVFTRSGITWSQRAKLLASDASANDQFGYSIGITDGACIVGAYGDNHEGGGDAGSAYIFTSGIRPLATTAYTRLPTANSNVADSIIKVASSLRAQSELPSALDNLFRAASTSKTINETTTITPTPSKISGYVKPSNETPTVSDTPVRPVGDYVRLLTTSISVVETPLKNVAYNKSPTLETVTVTGSHETPWQSIAVPNLYFKNILTRQHSIVLDAMDAATLGRFPSGTNIALKQGEETTVPCFNYSAFSDSTKSRYANLAQSGMLSAYEDYFGTKRYLPEWVIGSYLFGENRLISFTTIRTKTGAVDDANPASTTIGKWVIPYGSVLLNLNFDGTLGSETADAYVWSRSLLNGVQSSWHLLGTYTGMDNGTEQLIERVNGRMLYVQLKNITLGGGGTKVDIRLSGV